MVLNEKESSNLTPESTTFLKNLILREILVLIAFAGASLILSNGFQAYKAVVTILLYPGYIFLLFLDFGVMLPTIAGFIYLMSCLLKRRSPNFRLLGILIIVLVLLGTALSKHITMLGSISNSSINKIYNNYFSINSDYSNVIDSYIVIILLSFVSFFTYGIMLLLRGGSKLSKQQTIVLLILLLIAATLHTNAFNKVISYQREVDATNAILKEVSNYSTTTESKDSLINKCTSVRFLLDRTKCLMTLAHKSNDIAICSKILENGTNRIYNTQACMEPLILSAQDVSFCLTLTEERDKTFCITEVNKKFPQASTGNDNCHKLSSGKDRCYAERASRLRDKEACKMVSDEPIDWSKVPVITGHKLNSLQSYCEFNVDLQLAIDADNWQFCSTSSDIASWYSYDKANCYARFVNGPEDAEVCKNMLTGQFQESDRGYCYFRLARLTNNFSFCSNITVNYIKESCEANNQKVEFEEVDTAKLIFFDR